MTWVNIENGESALSIRNKINALGADVDTKAEQSDFNGLVSTVGTKADLVSGKVPESQIPSFIKTDSYMAWVTNTNTTALDAAFGKNNESLMKFLGNQLAMYSWFKGDSAATYPYTNLKNQNTLSDIIDNSSAYNEVRNNKNLLNLINSSPYAKNACINVLPMDGTTPISQCNNTFINFSTSTYSNQSLQSVIIPVSGLYTIKSLAGYHTGSTFSITVRKNGTSIGNYYIDGGSLNLTNQLLVAGDVIDVYVTSTTLTISMLFPLQVLSSRPIVYPATPTAGERVVQIKDSFPSVTHGSDSSGDDVYTFTAVPKAGVYRVRFGFNIFDDGKDTNTRVVVRVGSTEYYSVTGTTSGYPLTLATVDIPCAAGAVIKISNLPVSNTGMASDKFHGATLSIAASDSYPA